MLWLVELWGRSLALGSHCSLLPLFGSLLPNLGASFIVVQHFRVCLVLMYWPLSYGYHHEYLLTSCPDSRMILATKSALLVSKPRIYLSKSLCPFPGKINLTHFSSLCVVLHMSLFIVHRGTLGNVNPELQRGWGRTRMKEERPRLK